MTKKLESYNRELEEMLGNLKSFQEKYLIEKEEFNKHLASIEEKKKEIEEKSWLTQAEKQAQIEKMEETMAFKTRLHQREMDEQQKSYESAKKHYVEKNKLTQEASKAQQAAELLKIDITTKAGQKELDSRMEVHQEILEEQANFTKAMQALDAEMYPKDGGEKDASETWGEKYKDLVSKTTEYSNMLNSSTKEMFGAITKNIDQDIAKTKEEIAELTKKITSAKEELTLVQKRSAEELAKSKAELLAEEGDKEGGNIDKMKGELEEMEKLYNLEQELRTKNEQHKDDADYQDLTLTTDQQKRLTDLQDEHKKYAQSLKDKTNTDKQAIEKVAELEKEKTKKDDEVKKKEKQKKKVEAAQQVVQASVNIAQGVTKAWALGPIAGPIMAAIVGTAGAIQLAYMGKQISKMEDGGLLSGKRHSQGGMPILGSNIEVEGGEYVVNRQSTGKNLGLLGYINSQRRELGANDLNNYFSESPTSLRSMLQNELANGGQLPQMQPQVSVDNAQLLEAIQGINFSPRVSVTDINTVHDNMVKVDEWTGL